MNQDIYAEWLIKRKSPWYKIPYYLLVIVLVLAVLIFMISSPYGSWGIVGVAVIIIGVMFTHRYLKVEYEYVFVTSELSVDAIYSEQIRKNKLRVEMSDVESVQVTNEEWLKQKQEDKSIVFEDYTSHEKDADQSYTIIYTSKGATHILTFEPNEKLLHAMWRCSPSKVKIQR